MHEEIVKQYGNRVRLRACGLCWKEDKLLVINHFNLYQHDFWAPPGGGVDFGESSGQAVVREMMEETGLSAEIESFRFATEVIRPPLHAVELFFNVSTKNDDFMLGLNPETQFQIMTAVAFKSVDELAALPAHTRHGIFDLAPSTEKLKSLTGYFKI